MPVTFDYIEILHGACPEPPELGEGRRVQNDKWDSGVTGAVLSDQIKSLDWKARKAEYECGIPGEVTDEVLAKAHTLLS